MRAVWIVAVRAGDPRSILLALKKGGVNVDLVSNLAVCIVIGRHQELWPVRVEEWSPVNIVVV